MTAGIQNYPRKVLSERERTIREALDRFEASSTSATPGTLTTARKTADQTIASATLANVTELSFPLVNGAYYHFKFIVLARSADATVGVKLTVTYPATTTSGARVTTVFAADGSAAMWTGAITSSGDAVTATDVPAASTDHVSVVEGLLLPSAAGTLQLQAANETGTTNLTVRQGSCGILTVL